MTKPFRFPHRTQEPSHRPLASSPLFTDLYKHFYTELGSKTIPHTLLQYCNLPHFLAVLYMDDGSLCITSRVNHNNRKVYLTPHIYLYLQNYRYGELSVLNEHMKNIFNLDLHFGTRKDGHGMILRTTSVNETFSYLNTIKEVTLTVPSMYYKTNWEYRLKIEAEKWKIKYPTYGIITTNSGRWKNYTKGEIEIMLTLKEMGVTDKEIAKSLGRSYWSVVYKFRDLRGFL